MSDLNNFAFIEVNGWKVCFEKIGSGSNPILLIPGAIGTGRTDFEELLEGDDKLDHDKFTIIAVEAPGWGRSMPPQRKYGVNIYDNDCECFHTVMTDFGYAKYSIIGFSEGARVALLMATKFPESIKSLVVSGLSTYYSSKAMSTLLSDSSVDKWKKDKLESYLKVYETKDQIKKLWDRYLKFVQFYNQYFPEDMFKNRYSLVKCPVLLTHGDKDPIIEVEQPLNISERLLNAKLQRFSFGEHDAHRRYCAQYSEMVQDHILNQCDYNKSTREALAEKLFG